MIKMNFLKKELQVWRHYRLRKKKKIRVLFLFADSEVWSMANLYRKLQKDGRFEPVIGVLPYFHLDPTIACDPDKYKKSVLFCKKNHFQYVHLYKEKSGRFLSIGRYKPDVVCFNSTMYLAGIEEAFQFCRTHNVKTFFVSYGYFLSHGVDAIFNSPFQTEWTGFFGNRNRRWKCPKNIRTITGKTPVFWVIRNWITSLTDIFRKKRGKHSKRQRKKSFGRRIIRLIPIRTATTAFRVFANWQIPCLN